MDLEDWLLVLLYVVFQTMGALLSIVIAVSRLSGFWRSLSIIGIATVLVLPRTYAPAMMFLLQSAVVTMMWSARTMLRDHRHREWMPRFRFSLADVLHGGLVMCATLALIRVCWPHIDKAMTLAIAGLRGVVILVSVWLTLGSGRWTWRVLRSAVVGALIIATMQIHLLITGAEDLWFPGLLDDPAQKRMWWCDVSWPLCMIVILGCIRIQRRSHNFEHRSRSLHFLRAISAGALVVLGIISSLSALFVGWRLTFLPKVSVGAPVSPIGFETLAKAGANMHAPDSASEIPTVKTGDLQLLLDSNAEAIALARAGLQLPWGGSLNHDFKPSPEEFAYIGPFRDLSRVFALEAEVSARRQQHDQVASSALTGMQVGARLRSRGLLIDALVGNAIENEAVVIFRRHRHKVRHGVRTLWSRSRWRRRRRLYG